jgi:hypothetical protein
VFIWSLYHKAIVVNTWKAKANQLIDATYHCFDLRLKKFIHKLFECSQTRHAWSLALTIMNMLRCKPSSFSPLMGLFINQCLCGDDLPKDLNG